MLYQASLPILREPPTDTLTAGPSTLKHAALPAHPVQVVQNEVIGHVYMRDGGGCHRLLVGIGRNRHR